MNQFKTPGNILLLLLADFAVEIEEAPTVESFGRGSTLVILGGFLGIDLGVVETELVDGAEHLGGTLAAHLVSLDQKLVAFLPLTGIVVEQTHQEITVGLSAVNHLLVALHGTVVVAIAGIDAAQISHSSGVAVLVGATVILHRLGHILVLFAFINRGKHHGAGGIVALVGTLFQPVDGAVRVGLAAQAVVCHDGHGVTTLSLIVLVTSVGGHLAEIVHRFGILLFLIIETSHAQTA